MGFLQSLLGGGSFIDTTCNLLPYCPLLLLGMKLVMLLFIIGWVRTHLGGGLVATIVMLFVGYIALFQYFDVFGPITIIYLMVTMGLGGIVNDLAFGGHIYGKEPNVQVPGHSEEEMMQHRGD